jgi:NAD+ diphosphatase
LAGFVEPGESLEDAVRREVFEESGVRVASADYHSSQPWPFPASLMLGFSATAASRDLCIGPELEDARWFSLAEFEAALLQGSLKVPPSVSVSYRLIEAWYEKTSKRDFSAFLATVKAQSKPG